MLTFFIAETVAEFHERTYTDDREDLMLMIDPHRRANEL